MFRRKRVMVSMLTLVLGFSLICTPVLATSAEPAVQGQSQTNPGDTASAPVSTPGQQSSSAPVSSAPPPQVSSSAASKPASSSSTPVSSKASSSRSASSKPTKKKVVPPSRASSSEISSSEAGEFWGVSEVPSSGISLPPVGSVSEVENLIGSGVEVQTPKTMNWWGVLSWALIGLGILIVVIVLLSTLRRPPPGGPGRKRYRRHPFPTKKKRLLNDKYYRNKYD
ncbi:hypothetical protein [Faecalispora sporosphaeroides]|uniref:Uncharacterized protein n=1 Tax=Faecalispora sporosphaeroides TaxID=1549 RepID=A0A928Q262_9FIRM|nr:hypothetical protein [Faecalispora sporosphaeroides]MBE6832588.1 hypothetical protein [Faecalispora sporosphaeroides]